MVIVLSESPTGSATNCPSECSTSRRLRPPNGRRILTVRRSVQSRRRRVSHTEGTAAAGNHGDNRGSQPYDAGGSKTPLTVIVTDDEAPPIFSGPP